MAIRVIFFDLGDTLVTSPRRWLPKAQTLLKSLRQSGFRLGIISNTTGLNTRDAILDLLPTDFDLAAFETELILFSSEVGKAKPEQAIFDEAAARTGVPANQCLYCSENIVETLMAQQAGMRSICVQPPANSDLAAPHQAITKFQELTGHAP